MNRAGARHAIERRHPLSEPCARSRLPLDSSSRTVAVAVDSTPGFASDSEIRFLPHSPRMSRSPTDRKQHSKEFMRAFVSFTYRNHIEKIEKLQLLVDLRPVEFHLVLLALSRLIIFILHTRTHEGQGRRRVRSTVAHSLRWLAVFRLRNERAVRRSRYARERS